jgi:HEAT repeat protein
LGDRPFTGEWDEVIVMLPGTHDDPIGLVKWLAVEALARHAGRTALLAYFCWETSAAAGDAEAREMVVDVLIQALGDQEAEVRRWAAWALGKIKDPRAVEHLIQALGDPNAEVRSWAALALGSIGDARAIEPLIQALRDLNGWMRSKAAEVLGRIGDPLAVGPLIQALGDPDTEVRWGATEALGRIGDPRALPELERVAREDTGKTPWGRVADAAREAAEEIKRRMSSG